MREECNNSASSLLPGILTKGGRVCGHRCWDVLVVGNGPAGFRLAAQLADAGQSVLCVGRDRRPRDLLETLPPDTLARVTSPTAVSPCFERTSRWGSAVGIVRDPILDPGGSHRLVDRDRFDAGLGRHASACGACIVHGAVGRITRADNIWSVEVDGSLLNARLLVDATGRASHVARQIGVRRVWLDRLTGVANSFVVPGRRPHAVDIIAAPGGWWYAGPSICGDSIAIFFTDPDLSEFQAARCDGLAALARQSTALDGWVFDGSKRYYAAASGWLRQFSGPGWLAIGDAAMCLDPLSASGVTHALETADLAAAAWLAGDLYGYHLALLSQLQGYLSARANVYGRETGFRRHRFWARRNSEMTHHAS